MHRADATRHETGRDQYTVDSRYSRYSTVDTVQWRWWWRLGSQTGTAGHHKYINSLQRGWAAARWAAEGCFQFPLLVGVKK